MEYFFLSYHSSYLLDSGCSAGINTLVSNTKMPANYTFLKYTH